VKTTVTVDVADWFDGKASCVLVANVGTVIGGITAFPEATTDDGVLEVGVVTADGLGDWVRVMARLAAGRAEGSPLTRMTAGRSIRIELAEKLPYELDGGDRKKTKHLDVEACPAALTVCVPEEAPS
jgi:diacylglycerol kinase family enzyme